MNGVRVGHVSVGSRVGGGGVCIGLTSSICSLAGAMLRSESF